MCLSLIHVHSNLIRFGMPTWQHKNPFVRTFITVTRNQAMTDVCDCGYTMSIWFHYIIWEYLDFHGILASSLFMGTEAH